MLRGAYIYKSAMGCPPRPLILVVSTVADQEYGMPCMITNTPPAERTVGRGEEITLGYL